MSFGRSAPVVDLTLGASPAMSLLVAGVGLSAIGCVLFSGLAWWYKCIATAVIAFGGIHWVFMEGLRRASRSVVRLVLVDEDESMVVERAGRMRSVQLTHAVIITASVAVITLRVGRWHTRTLCIAQDAVDGETFRRLRMRLGVASQTHKQTGLREKISVAFAGAGRKQDI